MLADGLQQRAEAAGKALLTQTVGGMFGIFFTDQPAVSGFSEVMACDVDAFKRFFHGMLDEGVYFAPSAFEAGFVSAAHSDTDIGFTLDAAEKVLNYI